MWNWSMERICNVLKAIELVSVRNRIQIQAVWDELLGSQPPCHATLLHWKAIMRKQHEMLNNLQSGCMSTLKKLPKINIIRCVSSFNTRDCVEKLRSKCVNYIFLISYLNFYSIDCESHLWGDEYCALFFLWHELYNFKL